MLSPSSLPVIGWLYSSSVNSDSIQNSALTANDSANQSTGSFQSVFAQAARSPSHDQITSASSAGSARSAPDTKSQDKKSVVKPSRTESVQRAGKAERSTSATQTEPGSASSVLTADNTLVPSITAGQPDLPADSSPSLTTDKSNSAVSGSLGSRTNAASVAPTAGFSSLKDLSGAAFAMHITAVANPGSANQGSGGQGNAGQNAVPLNDADQTVPAANPAVSGDSLSALAKSAATDALSIQQPMPVSVATPVWLSAESSAAASQPSSTPAAVSTTVEVDEIGVDGSSGAPQTVRTVQVQLTAGEGQGRVDLRLVEHAGGLSVSVRASDATLTKGLQENLPDLSARLAADKYQTHMFIPPAREAAGGGASSGSSEQPAGQSQDNTGGRSFSQGGDANGQRDGQPAGQEAAWWRQLAALGKLSSSAANSVPNSVLGSPLSSAANPLTNQ